MISSEDWSECGAGNSVILKGQSKPMLAKALLWKYAASCAMSKLLEYSRVGPGDGFFPPVASEDSVCVCVHRFVCGDLSRCRMLAWCIGRWMFLRVCEVTLWDIILMRRSLLLDLNQRPFHSTVLGHCIAFYILKAACSL